jgi:uncharacterized protein (TIGR02284 family)
MSSKQARKAKQSKTPVLVVEEVTVMSRGTAPASASSGAGGTASPSPEVHRMNEYLRAELSAVETYDLAIRHVHDPEVKAALQQIRDAHAQHAQMLANRIDLYGGTPTTSAGVWGAFARIVQRGADLFGDRTALAALEQDEDHMLMEYRKSVSGLDVATQELVTNVMIPEHVQSRDLVRALERFVRAPK